MASGKRIDILGLGCVAVDDHLFVGRFPPPDAKTRVLARERHCGGLTATALVAAARLGARCAFAGVLGRDELSRFVLARLRAEGIDVSATLRQPNARPIYSSVVVDRSTGARNIFYDIEGVVGASESVPATLIRSCRVLFVDNFGVAGMTRASKLARRARIPVVADFENDSDPGFSGLWALADHRIVSKTFAASLTGSSSPQRAARKLLSSSCVVAVVTCGAEGCWYISRGWSAPKHFKAFKVEAVDTTGCGDVFHGAYAYGLALGMDLGQRICFSSATAALKATQPGGQAGIPSMPQVHSFLNHELDSQTR